MLRAHTAKVTIFDEVDAYPASASGGKSNAADDGEGDPILLAERASVTFPDAFSIKTSTPTFKNFGPSLFRVGNSILRTTGVSPYDNPGAKSRAVIREKVLFPKEKS